MEGVENEGNQAENVKMNGSRRVPPSYENEYADKKINQANDAQIIFRGDRLFGGRDHYRRFKRVAVSRKFISQLAPEACAPYSLGDVQRSGNPLSTYFEQQVALPNACASRRPIGANLPSLYSMIGIAPGYCVVRGLKAGALVKIQNGEDHRRQRR